MIELTMEEWGRRLLKTRRYITIHYNYIGKYTLIRDIITGNNYKATYNMTTHMMNLKKVG